MSAADGVAAPTAPGPRTRPEAPGLGWLLTRSLWLAGPVFSAGLLTGPLLLFLGRRAGLARFLWLGGVYTAAMLISYLMNPEAGPVMATVTWIIGSLHCFALNPQWLSNRWQAHSGPAGLSTDTAGNAPAGRSTSAAAATEHHGAPAGHHGAAAELLSDAALLPGAYFSDAPARGDRQAGPAAGTAVDVNSASARELMRLPGIGRTRAARAVARRSEKPFSSLQDFGARLGLGPRVLERLSGTVSFGSEPAAGPAGGGPTGPGPATTFGRRVDY